MTNRISFLMRYLWAVSCVAVLSGCAFWPVPGEKTGRYRELPTEKLDELLGRSENDLREAFSVQRPTVFSENGRRHLLYMRSRQWDSYFWPGLDVTFDTERCFRFTFSEDDKLQSFDDGYLFRSFDDAGYLYNVDKSPNKDCVQVFWTPEELASIRTSHENRAAEGDKKAAWIMAEEYGDTGPLGNLALSTKDIALARTLAVKYNNHRPLMVLAARDAQTEKELGLSSRARKPWLRSLAGLSNEEIDRLAEGGDPSAQFQQYLSNADPDPLKWLCRAADKGHPLAQYRLGELYWFGATELQKNLLLSYQWHRLSAAKGTHGSMLALVHVEAAMSPAQLSQAQHLYIDWAPGQCEMEIERNRIGN